MKINLDFKSQELRKIFEICKHAGIEIRVVGGAVRDVLLGSSPSDIDLAIASGPNDAVRLFENAGYKVIPSGIEFGTITLVTKERMIEITSLRKDISSDGRRVVVEYTKNFEEDSARRDFTINSMSYDITTGILYDYFGGVSDLENNLVRFIGDPKERIAEDYLRILRFFRFSAYYARSLDLEGLRVCKNLVSGLKILSKERIYHELRKILQCKKNISYIFTSMHECGLLEYVLPIAKQGIGDLLKFEEQIFQEDWVLDTPGIDLQSLRLGFLLFISGKKISEENLRFSKFSNRDITSFIYCYDFLCEIFELETVKYIYFAICKSWYYKPEYINNFLLICYVLGKIESTQLIKAIADMHNQAPPKMPVTSGEMMALGYTGITLGARKRYLENIWIKSGFTSTKEELLSLK